jgi:hypothetical protein
VHALCVFLIAFQPLIIVSMAQAKVSDLEFKRLSAVEILRFTVDKLKNELYSRAIPFASHALKRDLQVKLGEAFGIVIDPTKLATDAPVLCEIEETSDDEVLRF